MKAVTPCPVTVLPGSRPLSSFILAPVRNWKAAVVSAPTWQMNCLTLLWRKVQVQCVVCGRVSPALYVEELSKQGVC